MNRVLSAVAMLKLLSPVGFLSGAVPLNLAIETIGMRARAKKRPCLPAGRFDIIRPKMGESSVACVID